MRQSEKVFIKSMVQLVFVCVCMCVWLLFFFFFLLMSLFHAQGDMGRYYEQLVEHVLTSDESGQKAYVL